MPPHPAVQPEKALLDYSKSEGLAEISLPSWNKLSIIQALASKRVARSLLRTSPVKEPRSQEERIGFPWPLPLSGNTGKGYIHRRHQ